jgi:hypothetical protein
MWFTEYAGNKIGRIDVFGAITEFPLPTANSYPLHIAACGLSTLWFTQGSTRVGKITTAGAITEISTGYSPDGGIDCGGSDGGTWFPVYNNAHKIGRMQPLGTSLGAAYTIPSGGAARDIARGPDASYWFVESIARVGKVVPTTGVVTEFPVPSAGTSIASAGGYLWFTEAATNKIARITTAGVVNEYAIPTAASSPTGIAAGPGGNVWFLEKGANKVAKLVITTAKAPSPEVASTGASGVGSGWATLSAEVNPNGVATFAAFEFGTTTDYGRTTISQPLGSGTGRVAVSAPATDLDCETTYHYRAVALNEFIEVQGPDQTLTTGACSPGLLLRGGLYRVHGTYLLEDGRQGELRFGKRSEVSAVFSFDDPNDVQGAVKVVDGCAVDGRDWVFVGGLTDQEVYLHVDHTEAGTARLYANALKNAWRPVLDTEGFECPRRRLPDRPMLALPAAAADACGSETVLCLNGGLHRVEGTYRLQDGRSGSLRFTPLTASSGYATFDASSDDADDLQVMVKVLDVCSFYRSTWAFLGGLTDQELHIAVTHSETGVVKRYDNELKQVFEPVQDLDAFECPSRR